MSDVLAYKGYTAHIEFDAEDRLFFGRLSGIEDGVGFHAHTVEELVSAFHEAVDDHIEACDQIGKQPEQPAANVLRLQLDPDLLARITEAARRAGQSSDQFSLSALSRAASGHIPQTQLHDERLSFLARLPVDPTGVEAVVAGQARVAEETIVGKSVSVQGDYVSPTAQAAPAPPSGGSGVTPPAKPVKVKGGG